MSGEFKEMVSIFDAHKQAVLTFPVNIQGKDDMMYLIRELMYVDNEGDSVDIDALIRRMNKLPAVLTFFGTMQWQAQRLVEDTKQDFDLWLSQQTEKEYAEMFKKRAQQEINGKPVAASTVKAPTNEEVRNSVRARSLEEWDAKKAPLRIAEERLGILTNLMAGLKAAISLAESEGRLIATLINRGIETPGIKVPDSPSTKKFTPKPHDEAF